MAFLSPRRLLAFVAVALLLWGPWLSPAALEARVQDFFQEIWSRIPDGCGMACEHCGVHVARWAPFGRRVEVEFACGLLLSDALEFHEHRTAFVSSLGTVHGLPRP